MKIRYEPVAVRTHNRICLAPHRGGATRHWVTDLRRRQLLSAVEIPDRSRLSSSVARADRRKQT